MRGEDRDKLLWVRGKGLERKARKWQICKQIEAEREEMSS